MSCVQGIEREPLDVQYIQSFFWAVMVTSGIGYDVAPQTNIEAVFTILVIMVGIIMYAAIIGSISSAIATLDATSIRRSQRLEEVTTYLRAKHVPARLRYEISDFYRRVELASQASRDFSPRRPPQLQI